MGRNARSWTLSISLALAATLLGVTQILAMEDADAAPEPATIDDRADAAEADGDAPRRKLIRWNEYHGPYFSFRVGTGFLVDGVTYDQDEDSKEQLDLDPEGKLRDFRLLFRGYLLHPRITYTLGYMYDGDEEEWRFRQTGFMFDMPELWGRLFVGRTKEGISMNKIMVGYQGFTMERATANDAFVPILADGMKWMGNSPGGSFLWSVGTYMDQLTDKESFNKFDNQTVVRGVWLPIADAPSAAILHFGLGYRWAKANNGTLQFKSKPESFAAQVSAIDTGKFDAENCNLAAPEIYYRRGPWLLGVEYFLQFVNSNETGDPFFHGGEIVGAYLITGETRPYNRRGGYFDRISPARPIFDWDDGWGGWGAWEVVARFSYTDLDDSGIEGGTFWRITPVLNWYLTDNLRFVFSYGYGVLDRFDTKGGTHFFGTRFQFQL